MDSGNGWPGYHPVLIIRNLREMLLGILWSGTFDRLSIRMVTHCTGQDTGRAGIPLKIMELRIKLVGAIQFMQMKNPLKVGNITAQAAVDTLELYSSGSNHVS